MDAVYLQREVGGALTKGLAAVTSAQPYDPVGYLGQWLLQYVQNQAHEKEVLFTFSSHDSISFLSCFSISPTIVTTLLPLVLIIIPSWKDKQFS